MTHTVQTIQPENIIADIRQGVQSLQRTQPYLHDKSIIYINMANFIQNVLIAYLDVNRHVFISDSMFMYGPDNHTTQFFGCRVNDHWDAKQIIIWHRHSWRIADGITISRIHIPIKIVETPYDKWVDDNKNLFLYGQ